MTKPTDSKSTSSTASTPQGRRFDETFKLDAVQPREQTGRPRAQVARDLGVSQVTPAAWETRYGSAGAGAGTRSAAASPGAGPGGTMAALAEVARLRGEGFGTDELCEAMEVSRSGYYAHRQKPEGRHRQEDSVLRHIHRRRLHPKPGNLWQPAPA